MHAEMAQPRTLDFLEECVIKNRYIYIYIYIYISKGVDLN